MFTLKNFMLVVINLVAELWSGPFHKSSFYDKRTPRGNSTGYFTFVTASLFVTIALAGYLYLQFYK
ncbi:hypothetical protein [Paenibacillus lemnae]|uniref:Uncharacterized protein n=1 Tax=Paenibacillus lemnae TaxID=1330551 RepID=A0A848M3R3_PAELE|nr:hypothetical protein [Paenibacillus lemnae]NMO94850.1 hypothetical protein [Paenibacillus lemnae]